MRLEIFILGITAFFIYNAYHDGKYTKMAMVFKKYYKMIFYALLGVGIYIILKRNPSQGRNMLLYANNVVKFMPIDKSSMDMLSPVFDFTNSNSNSNSNNYLENGAGGAGFMGSLNNMLPQQNNNSNSERRLLGSGKTGTKRSVSETKKKYVASQQSWKCGDCGEQLNAWFEVDHKVRLEYGGGNDVQNLVALCRECHGKKTAMENM
jgi:5-methylcytosine-specific restriction endonuclease McrA